MNFFSFLTKNKPKSNSAKYLKLQFYIVEDNGNGFILDAHGLPLYKNPSGGLPWIGTEEMLDEQLKFIIQSYEKQAGRKPKEVLIQQYEGFVY